MVAALGILLALVLLAAVLLLVRGKEEDVRAAASLDEVELAPALGRRHPFLPWIAGVATAAVLHLGFALVPWIAGAIGVLVGIAAAIGLEAWTARRAVRLELQLADGVDLIVSALRAGSGLSDALTRAARQSRAPFRECLNELVERIRLGDDPLATLNDLQRRYPLESFRLFTFTLAAHWEGGGSLATTLSNVGTTIRDRVTVRRRVRAQAIETQVSVLGVLVVTYGLAILMWNNYPDRLEAFTSSELGSAFVALSIFLQGIGLLWISRMTRIEV